MTYFPARAEADENSRSRLVVLDPLVHLHRLNENTVSEVAPVLGFLRDV